jgi:hypothetical protein
LQEPTSQLNSCEADGVRASRFQHLVQNPDRDSGLCQQAIAAMRQAENIPANLLAHRPPVGWEHVNLIGDYVWVAGQNMPENKNRLR